jgi:hypothetical protein
MGQRQQIFVFMTNPAKNLQASPAEKKELEKEFGTKDTTILAFHNQWLYGRSSLQSCLGLLNFGAQFTKEAKTSDKAPGGYSSPITIKGQNYKTKDHIISSIEFILNYRPKKTAWSDAGVGESFYIGKEDERIRENFTMGDNNDGITIIDLIENKYCFMNIYEQDKETTHGIYSLPELKPVDARAYVSAYYGETIETTNPYYFGDHDRSKITKTIKEQQTIVNHNIKINNKAVKGFDKFQVLTLKEISAMFPKMKLTKKVVVAG